MKWILILAIAVVGTYILQAQVKPPEREFVFKVPQRLIQSYALLMDGRVDDIPLGQYKELIKIFQEQAYAQQQAWKLQDSIQAAKTKPPVQDTTKKKN